MTSPASTPPAASSLMKSMAIWLIFQLVALAIGAAGVPLSASWQPPPEQLSIQIMVVTQVAVSALLWPMLFSDARSAIAVIVTAPPFIQAAGFLSATTGADLLVVAAMMSVWLLTLSVLPQPTSYPTFMTATRMIVIAWAIGGALLTYLHAELSADANSFSLGPAVRIVARLRGEPSTKFWIECAIVIAISFASRFFLRASREKKVK